MPINTAAKRRYATSILPIHKVPIPNAAKDVAWRATAAWIYAGNYYPIPTVTINGIAIQFRKGSLLIEERIEERSIAEFTVVDTGGTASYQRGQPVVIYNGLDVLFGGVIDTSDKVAMAPAGGLHHPIRCMDWHYLADKRLIAESYLATAAGTIVENIRSTYLDDEGITVGNIETGPDIVEAIFNYVRTTDAFDALAEKSDKIWYIDQHKKLYFQARNISPAPWTADLTHKIDDCKLSSGNPLYRNRQYIRGGKGTTVPQTETFVADGKQVAFTVAFPLAQTPSDATGSIKHDPPSVAKTVGIKGIDEAKEYYWNKGDPTVYAATAPGAGVEVEVIYNGLYNILTLVEDIAEIANQLAIEGNGTGFVDDIADEPTLTLKQASFDSGQAKLTKFGVVGKKFTYQTIQSGLEIGQIQTVNYPLLGLNNAEMLIESIRARIIGGIFVYNIVVLQGPTMGSWTKLFKALADMKSEVIERLNVGSEQILIILVPLAENWGWNESYTDIVTLCPFPAADLYPEADLYPC